MNPSDLLITNILNPNATKTERFCDRAWFMALALLVTCTILQAIPS